jgi:multidrug efflux system membrane fusion protein
LPNITTTIEKKPYILAIAIVLVIVLWMLSGDSKADQKALQSDQQVQERLPKVQVMPLVAKNIN